MIQGPPGHLHHLVAAECQVGGLGDVARQAVSTLGGCPEPVPEAVYCGWRHTMAAESLADVIRSLTPHEQDAVRQFIEYLKQRNDSARSQSPFLQAADDFIAQHPELLQRLAQ